METYLEMKNGQDMISVDVVNGQKDIINISTGNEDLDTGIYLSFDKARELADHIYKLVGDTAQITNIVSEDAINQVLRLKSELQACVHLQNQLPK